MHYVRVPQFSSFSNLFESQLVFLCYVLNLYILRFSILLYILRFSILLWHLNLLLVAGLSFSCEEMVCRENKGVALGESSAWQINSAATLAPRSYTVAGAVYILSTHLSVCISVYMSTYLSMHAFLFSIHLCICVSIRLFICLHVYLTKH